MTEQLDILTLDAARLDDAAALLAGQQRRLRAARPELPAAYEDPGACRPYVAAVLEKDGAHGVLAVRDGQPAGFLAGYPRTDEIWARAAWINMSHTNLYTVDGSRTAAPARIAPPGSLTYHARHLNRSK